MLQITLIYETGDIFGQFKCLFEVSDSPIASKKECISQTHKIGEQRQILYLQEGELGSGRGSEKSSCFNKAIIVT